MNATMVPACVRVTLLVSTQLVPTSVSVRKDSLETGLIVLVSISGAVFFRFQVIAETCHV